MVKLEPIAFAAAAARMCELSGVKKTRLVVKLRRKEGKIYLRATDDRSTLTTTLIRQSELKTLESIVTNYASRCVADAPEDDTIPTSGSSKKAAAVAAEASVSSAVAASEQHASTTESSHKNSNSHANSKGGKGGKGKKK
eukprot:GILI01037754.1.p1 GENE.GILI01037754.1~~GILI01037754.1.p1  ORF type:complete len:140 (-),score=32.86 GILI01037754.1:76-495(-)